MNGARSPGSPVPYWAWGVGATVLCVPGALVVAARVVSAYGESTARGQSALTAVGIGVVSILVLFAVMLAISSILRSVQLRNVRRLISDPVFAGRTFTGFAETIRAFGGVWPPQFHFYSVSLGPDGFTFWTGTRNPRPGLTLPWSEFHTAGTVVVNDYTGRYHALALHPVVSTQPMLALALIDWSSSSLSRRRVRSIAASLPIVSER